MEEAELQTMASITKNPFFEEGVASWRALTGGDPRCCLSFHTREELPEATESPQNSRYVLVSGRKASWQGLAQDVQLEPNRKYKVSSEISIAGADSAPVHVTLNLKHRDGSEWKKAGGAYICLGSVTATKSRFVTLSGELKGLLEIPPIATAYVEGPPGGVDLLVASFSILSVDGNPQTERRMHMEEKKATSSITRNSYFREGTAGWYVLAGGSASCQLSVHDVKDLPKTISPPGNSKYAVLSGRKAGWHGVAQDIEPQFQANRKYEVRAEVAVRGVKSAQVLATLALKNQNGSDWKKTQNPYINMGSVTASDSEFVILAGILKGLNEVPPKLTAYLEGPPGCTDLFISSFSICAVDEPKPFQPPESGPFPKGGLNIVLNGNFEQGTAHWGTMGGTETLTVTRGSSCGSPHGPPVEPSSLPSPWPSAYPLLSRTLSHHLPPPSRFPLPASFSCYSCCPDGPSQPPKYPLSSPSHSALQNGKKMERMGEGAGGGERASSLPPLAGPTVPYLVVRNRTKEWMGPMQKLTERVKPLSTYAVTAWVKLGPGKGGSPCSHGVNMTISVDGKWINGGMVEANSQKWVRCIGSFRIEKKVVDVTLYLQGAMPGVDLWLADVRVVEVDWKARVDELKLKAEEVRKRDVIFKVRDSNGRPVPAAFFSIDQTERGFPLGSCINSRDIRNTRYQEYFVKHFNFAVFENELKWKQMEWTRGDVNYTAADSMLQFLEKHKIPVRGHCIFWDNEFPDWLRALPDEEAAGEVDKRVVELVRRYKGRFQHYDVNNEMLHGGYFTQRFGPGVIARMFQLAYRTDPNAKLFVNDYHVGDGCDWKSTPEKYAESVRELLKSGAPVGGIGIQGHITAPVGVHFKEALDVLGEIGLPIWLTEMDVNSVDERVRADDLELMLREAFAHEAVEGVVLWGFWKGEEGASAMAVANAHLVNEDWSLNEGGRRLDALLKEWRTEGVRGLGDANGVFPLRAHLGKYRVRVQVGEALHEEEVVLEKGFGAQVVNIVI